MGELIVIRQPTKALPKSTIPNLRGLDRNELSRWYHSQYLLFTQSRPPPPRYRIDQLFRWIQQRRAIDFAIMSDLPKHDRELLSQRGRLDPLSISTVQRSNDGTRKLRLSTPDGQSIESVLIPNEDRGYTLCISSQVGCALTCRFCATATLDFHRNLETWEIVDQVHRAYTELNDSDSGRIVDPEELNSDSNSTGSTSRADDPSLWTRKISNLVFMGMGEPLHNYNQVRKAIMILSDRDGLGIAARRITISSSGLVPAIERFAEDPLAHEVRLAISLNATTDRVRSQIMPINQRWDIARLLQAVEKVPTHERRSLTFEYVLLANLNDTDTDAFRLAKLLKQFHCHVNVIPFNPSTHAPFQRPSLERVQQFVKLCRDRGLRCYVRTPRGDDISAACGQLALEANEVQT